MLLTVSSIRTGTELLINARVSWQSPDTSISPSILLSRGAYFLSYRIGRYYLAIKHIPNKIHHVQTFILWGEHHLQHPGKKSFVYLRVPLAVLSPYSEIPNSWIVELPLRPCAQFMQKLSVGPRRCRWKLRIFFMDFGSWTPRFGTVCWLNISPKMVRVASLTKSLKSLQEGTNSLNMLEVYMLNPTVGFKPVESKKRPSSYPSYHKWMLILIDWLAVSPTTPLRASKI